MKKFQIKMVGRTYLKYLLSYLLVSMVLIVGFFMIIRNQLTEKYFQQLCAETQSQVNNLAVQLDDDILYLSQVDTSITQNIDLILSRYSSVSGHNYQTYQELEKYADSNKLIHSIVYAAKNSDTVLSTKLPINYSDGIFYFFNGTKNKLEFDPGNYYDSSSSQLIYLHDEESPYLIYFPPTRSSANYLYFFTLNYSAIEQHLKNMTSSEVPAIALVDEHKQLAAGVNTEHLSDYIANFTLSPGIYELDASTSLCVSTSVNNRFSIVALISNSFLLEQINDAFASSYQSLLLLAFIGFLMILLAMRITYLPLHKLTKKIVSSPAASTGYLDQLDLAFSEVEEHNQKLKEKLDKYRLSMKKSLFDTCINPDYTSKELPNPNIDQFFDEELNGKIFLIYVKTKVGVIDFIELQNYFLEMLPGNDSCFILNKSINHTVFLINYIGTEPNKKEVLIELLHNLHEEYGYLCAISNGTNSPVDIPSLYENILASSTELDSHSVVDFNLLSSPDTSFVYPHDKLNRLTELLKEYKFKESKIIIEDLFQIINQAITIKNNFPDFFVRCILVDTLSIIINAINQSKIKFETYSELYFQTIYLCQNCSYIENEKTILNNTEKLIEFYEQKVADKMISPAQIRQMILSSYCDPDFSIAIMADNFQISIAYMSYLVKMNLGLNFSEYLWNLRLDKAKDLLLSTDMSIDEISMAVGYLNTSSFRRKFKQETGITPSQFRHGK